jgi:hypothetical protein
MAKAPALIISLRLQDADERVMNAIADTPVGKFAPPNDNLKRNALFVIF